MDPQTTLNELFGALRERNRDDVLERLEALSDWIRKGGLLPNMPDAPPPTRYQGWENHATWNVNLWLNNDEGTYHHCCDLAREAVSDADDCEQVDDGIWTAEEARRFLLADKLGEYLEEMNPLQDQPSLFSDLITSALQDVNYDEIAVAFLESIDE
jgi:hypothetical protein